MDPFGPFAPDTVKPLPTPQVGEIATALAKAQLEMSNPKFDTQNPFFKNRYASLAAVRDAVVPVLAKHGICLTQDLQTSDAGVSCITVLTHSSGQRLSFGPYTLPVSKCDAQGFGSASTYARRYHLMAVCGVVGDADDDAEGAVDHDHRGPSQDSVRALAAEFTQAHKIGIDGPVLAIHEKANADTELYRTAWALLSASTRKDLKAMIERAKAGT